MLWKINKLVKFSNGILIEEKTVGYAVMNDVILLLAVEAKKQKTIPAKIRKQEQERFVVS